MRKVYQAVAQIMADILAVHPDVITPDTQVSSLKYQELAAAAIACEKTFHIEIEDERVTDLHTVSDWTAYIQRRLSDQDDHYAPPTDEEREKWYYR